MKKILALILALVMLLSLLTACAGKTEENPAETPKEEPAESTEPSSEPSAETSEPAERKDSWLCDEKTTLTVFTYDRINNTYEVPSNDLEFWKWMEDYTNVHIEWEISPVTGYEEVLAAKLSSGADLADIVMVRDPLTANEAGLNGAFVNLSDYWDTCFTNTEAYYNSINLDYRSLFTNEDESMYALDGTLDPYDGHVVLMYNAEWLEKLDREVPETLDDFTSLLRDMQAAGDLNGNGKDDEIYLTSSGITHVLDIIGNSFGIEQYEGWNATVADENGVVRDEYTSEAMKNDITYLNMLYEEGLLDPEICSMSMDALSEKIAADRVGVFIFYSAFSYNYGQLTSAGLADPTGEHHIMGPTLSSEYVEEPYMIFTSLYDNTSTGVNAKSENAELAMKWLDVLLADPLATQTRIIGFEGTCWEYDENGEPTPIIKEDGTMADIAKMGCGQIVLPHYQNEDSLYFYFDVQVPWMHERWKELTEKSPLRAPSVPQVAVMTDEEREKLDMVNTDIQTYWKEMRDKFIKGEISIDAEWDTYVSTLKQLGLDTFVEVYQSVYDRTR